MNFIACIFMERYDFMKVILTIIHNMFYSLNILISKTSVWSRVVAQDYFNKFVIIKNYINFIILITFSFAKQQNLNKFQWTRIILTFWSTLSLVSLFVEKMKLKFGFFLLLMNDAICNFVSKPDMNLHLKLSLAYATYCAVILSMA